MCLQLVWFFVLSRISKVSSIQTFGDLYNTVKIVFSPSLNIFTNEIHKCSPYALIFMLFCDLYSYPPPIFAPLRATMFDIHLELAHCCLYFFAPCLC